VAIGISEEGRYNVTAGTPGTAISASSSGTPMSITVYVYNPITTNI
jgi:hypothetical protein